MSIVSMLTVSEAASLTSPPARDELVFSNSPKLLGLELLRFASAMAVLLYHYNHFAQIPGVPPTAWADFPYYAWLWPLFDYGYFGVEFFWGISGYIFFWKYGQAIHAREVSARRFFWLRFSRLYPLHLLTLMLVAGLQLVHRYLTGGDYIFQSDDAGQFARQLVMASDWGASPSRSFNGPIWSVSAEVAVYAAFFLLLRRYRPSAVLCACIAMIGLALLLTGFSSVPVSCAILFFAGGIAAQVTAGGWPLRIGAGVVGSGIMIGAGIAGLLGDVNYFPIVLMFALPFLLWAMAGDIPSLNRFQRSIHAAGNLTYSTYLLNFPIQLMVAVAVAWSGIMPNATHPALLFAYLASVLVAGAFCYREFEIPVQHWIRRRMFKPRKEA